MKTYIDVHKATGRKSTFKISVVDGGYVRVGGGIAVIGYETAKGRRYELGVNQDVLERILNHEILHREEVSHNG